MNGIPVELISITIIVLFIAGSVLILYLLGQRWKKQADSDLKDLRVDFRRYSADVSTLTKTIQEYDEVDREPFISRVATLQGGLNNFKNELADWENGYVAIQDRIHNSSSNPWMSIIGALGLWFNIRNDIKGLHEKVSDLDTTVEELRIKEKSLKQLGWEVAQKARSARNIDQRVMLLLDQLAAKHVQGDSVDNLRSRERRARESINEIPEFFLAESEATVLELAEEESITKTFQILTEVGPELDVLYKQAHIWDRQCSEAVKIVTRMRRVLGGLESAVSSTTENLDLGDFNQRIYGLNIICQNLHATLSRLEVESIPAVIAEATRVQVNAQEMNAALAFGRKEISTLVNVLVELKVGMKELSQVYARLASAEIHPIHWVESQQKLVDLSQKVNQLAPPEQPRKVDEIKSELETVNDLNQQRSDLMNHCQEIASQHTDLLAIFRSPEIRHSGEWFKDAHQLAQRVNVYAPENWPQADALASFDQDISTTENDLQRLIHLNPEKPVPEGELSAYLAEVRGLEGALHALRRRARGIENRLTEIQAIESSTREAIKAVEAHLTQITYLVNSNTYLNEAAGRQLSRFEDQLGGLINELSQKQQGSIEKKAGRVNAFAAKVEESTRKWLTQLTSEVMDGKSSLTTTINELDNIASLDEKPLYDARVLLSSMPVYNELDSKSIPSLNDLIRELKLRSDYWQELSAVQNALYDIVSPVLESFDQADQSRTYVLEQFDDLDNWLKKSSDWPPTTVKLDQEDLELKNLEAQWKSVKGAPTKAITLVQKLSTLGGKYQMLTEKIYHAGERVADQQGQVDELEKDLDLFETNWQAQKKAYQSSPTAQKEIDGLLSNADREYEMIKREYKAGKKNYDDVIGALKNLHRQMRLAQISIDDTHVIDMNGRAIVFRE